MKRLLILIFCSVSSFTVAQWPRWGNELDLRSSLNSVVSEERTLDCTNVAKTDQCVLLAPKSKVVRDPANYRCRREPMPQSDWNSLAKSSKTRLACPIGCEPDADLSVLQKKPIDLEACKKYYTYGKYRDQQANEWFLWIAEPCLAANITTLTTHCRFKDIPLYPEKQEFASRS
ncbi:hypothetical protein M3Y98_00800100 [Aphelenchoides besseyi]|nr:hypothetical protein M3Y98_00800100 [Aphelenchoides besseyi]